MSPTIATTSTLAMLRTVESRGFETRDLLAAAALDRATVEDPDARLPAGAVVALWNALRERSGDPVLQLAAPTTLPFGAYRVILACNGTATRACPPRSLPSGCWRHCRRRAVAHHHSR
jgi:hypothetical protein